MTATDNFNQIISSSTASTEVPFQQFVASRISTQREESSNKEEKREEKKDVSRYGLSVAQEILVGYYSYLKKERNSGMQTRPVAARSKTQVCGRSRVQMVGSNPARGMDVFLICVYIFRQRSLRRADRSSREVLPIVVRRCVCDLEASRIRRPWLALGRSAPEDESKLSFIVLFRDKIAGRLRELLFLWQSDRKDQFTATIQMVSDKIVPHCGQQQNLDVLRQLDKELERLGEVRVSCNY